MLPHLRLQLPVIWLSCQLLFLSKAEDLTSATACDFAYHLAQNITCLHDTIRDDSATTQQCGTRYIDDCHQRCTSAALNDGWSTTNDYEDCLLYANISQHMSPLSQYYSNRTILADNLVRVSDVEDQVRNSLAQCMIDFCSLSPRCATTPVDTGCTLHSLIQDDGSIATDAVLRCKASLCPELVMNADIFGIGVFIASILQICLAFAFVTGLLTLQFSHHRQSSKHLALSLTAQTQRIEEAQIRSIDSRLERTKRIRRVILKATATFQQAQCYYVLALTIATVYAIAPLGVRQLNELDQQALVFIAGCNIYLTSVVLLMVLFADREGVSTFTFYLSFLTWLATIITSQFVYGSVPYYNAYRRTPGPQCSHKTLLSVCETDMRFMSEKWYFMTAPVIFLCFLTFYDYCHWRLWTSCPIPLSQSPYVNSLGAQVDRLIDRLQARRHIYLLNPILFEVMETKWLIAKGFTILAACVISMTLWVSALQTRNFRRAITTEWTFGQVVALTVWLPVLVEFMSLSWAEISEPRRRRIKQRVWCFPNGCRPSLRGKSNSNINISIDPEVQSKDQDQEKEVYENSSKRHVCATQAKYYPPCNSNGSSTSSTEEISLLQVADSPARQTSQSLYTTTNSSRHSSSNHTVTQHERT